MNNYTMTTTDGITLTSVQRNNTWCVLDSDGGVWWPSLEAEEEIDRAEDPAMAVVRMCADEPMRGSWAD